MVRYRRNFLAASAITLTLRDRRSRILIDHVGLLRESFRAARQRHPFAIDAIIVLPEHLHMIVTMPPSDAGYDTRIRFLKSCFSRRLKQSGVPVHRNERGEYDLWQRRYWEHTIRDDDDLQRHVDYIHFNPVKHGHALRAADWPHSSIHRYIRFGWMNQDWAFEAGDVRAVYGESTT